MESKLVLIAGGSGSGKSTLAIGLQQKHPETFAVLHLDDYYKSSQDAPKLEDGTPNWDHPDALDFDQLVKDTETLLRGESIEIFTKSELYNPDYDPRLKNKIRQIIESRSIILLEGYLSLYDERLRNLAGMSFYLDMPIKDSIQRRGKNKFIPPEGYFDTVLIPVHAEYVEPTRQYADFVLTVSDLSPEEAGRIVEEEIMVRSAIR